MDGAVGRSDLQIANPDDVRAYRRREHNLLNGTSASRASRVRRWRGCCPDGAIDRRIEDVWSKPRCASTSIRVRVWRSFAVPRYLARLTTKGDLEEHTTSSEPKAQTPGRKKRAA
jgi:hypothetical protein